MTTYVALLYSIILPAGKRLVMTDLKAMANAQKAVQERYQREVQ